MTIQDVLRSIFVYTMAFVMLSMLLLIMPLILDTHQSMSVSTRNGAISYLNGIGYEVIAQAGTPLANDLYTRNVYPGSGSTFDVGANGNEYAEGWYDKVYAGGSEVVRTATLVIAASDSSAAAIAQSDFQSDGIADNIEIQAALDAIDVLGGGSLYFHAGTYHPAAKMSPGNNTKLFGAGQNASVLEQADNTDDTMFEMINVSNVTFEDMGFDGESATQASGYGFHWIDGIRNNMVRLAIVDFREAAVRGDSASVGLVIDAVRIRSNKQEAIVASGCAEWYIVNSLIGFGQDLTLDSLVLSGSHEFTISNSYIDRGKWGIYFFNSDNNKLSNTIVELANQHGVVVGGSSSGNSLTANTFRDNGKLATNTYDGLFFSSTASYNSATANHSFNDTIYDVAINANRQRYGINISAATNQYNLIHGNILNNELANATGGINDSGGNTTSADNIGA